MVRSISHVRRGSKPHRASLDAETGVYRQPRPARAMPEFPPALSDAEILDIVDDLTQSLDDYW